MILQKEMQNVLQLIYQRYDRNKNLRSSNPSLNWHSKSDDILLIGYYKIKMGLLNQKVTHHWNKLDQDGTRVSGGH